MTSPIFSDADAKPRLFRWNGRIDVDELVDWVGRRDWTIPPDLLEFWAATGGGEAFESEVFPKPLVGKDDEDGVEHATTWRHSNGMLAGLIVFHEGLCYSAVRCQDQVYVSLDEEARITGQYRSFGEWYRQVLREEYAERYGLAPT